MPFFEINHHFADPGGRERQHALGAWATGAETAGFNLGKSIQNHSLAKDSL